MARDVLASAPVRAMCLVAAIAGCSYRAGSFSALGHDFAGERVSLGCVDLAVARRPDGPLGAILAYDIGNRCDTPVWLDLASPAVIGRVDNADIELAAYDPRAELRRLPLDGRALATETIEYRARVAVPFDDICVDTGRIVGGAADWQCVGPAPELDPR